MIKPWYRGAQFHSPELRTQIIPISEVHCARGVAAVYAGFGDGDEVANLIAAAPDLLAALRPLVAIVNGARVKPAKRAQYLDEARAALAKAEWPAKPLPPTRKAREATFNARKATHAHIKAQVAAVVGNAELDAQRALSPTGELPSERAMRLASQVCAVCDRPFATGAGCTNRCCIGCHQRFCTPGGTAHPGHGIDIAKARAELKGRS
jgi:hypothetical protein